MRDNRDGGKLIFSPLAQCDIGRYKDLDLKNILIKEYNIRTHEVFFIFESARTHDNLGWNKPTALFSDICCFSFLTLYAFQERAGHPKGSLSD